jgi:hypothetical protein
MNTTKRSVHSGIFFNAMKSHGISGRCTHTETPSLEMPYCFQHALFYRHIVSIWLFQQSDSWINWLPLKRIIIEEKELKVS